MNSAKDARFCYQIDEPGCTGSCQCVCVPKLSDFCVWQFLQLPQSLRLEPMRLAAGSILSLPAGSGLPETSISVMNGAGNKIVKALVAGHRQQLKMVSDHFLYLDGIWM
eukprot:GHUV01048542.1.p1 GENE.GHUV01048542.1~~GHUV01048542.1.p1  ORF type:complete len:109 (+),score=22.38 GHUV01048542.1:587-913(+)